jgi:hypothetical protein
LRRSLTELILDLFRLNGALLASGDALVGISGDRSLAGAGAIASHRFRCRWRISHATWAHPPGYAALRR